MTRKRGISGVIVTVAVMLGVALALERPELLGIHQDAGLWLSGVCINCHGDKTSGSADPQTGKEEISLDPDIPTFHAVHMDNPLLNLECTTCHASVDLLEGSSEHLRKQVNVEICQICHTDYFAYLHEEQIGGN